MNKALLLSFITLFMSGAAFAQGWLPQGARSASMGGASVTLIDPYAYHHNPGALAFLENGTVGLSYESRYLLKELQSQSFSVAQPLKKGVISIGGQFYGYEQFRTNRLGAGYSMKLSDNIAAGVQLNYLSLRLDPAYGVRHTMTGEFGLLGKINEDIAIGFSVVNLGRAKLSDYKDERFSTLIRLGASYQLVEDLLITGEVLQEVAYKARVRGGFEYNPSAIEMFYVRCGVQSNPMELAFGFGIDFDRVKLDLATQYNQLLGWTPSAGLVVDFWNKNSQK